MTLEYWTFSFLFTNIEIITTIIIFMPAVCGLSSLPDTGDGFTFGCSLLS